MKLSGRRLIVEYKNRRSRNTTKSLWGEINLKAIAEEVENDTSSPETASKVVKPTTETPSSTPVSEQPTVAQTGTPSSVLQAATSEVSSKSVEPAPQIADKSVDQSAKRSSPKAASLKPQKKPVRVKKPSLELKKLDVTATKATDAKKPTNKALTASKSKVRATKPQITRVQKADVASDIDFQASARELASLETENQKLKQQLIKHLRAENKQLLQMIKRAEKPIE